MLLQILTSSLKVLFRGYPEKVQLSTVHTCGTELWTNNTDSEGAGLATICAGMAAVERKWMDMSSCKVGEHPRGRCLLEAFELLMKMTYNVPHRPFYSWSGLFTAIGKAKPRPSFRVALRRFPCLHRTQLTSSRPTSRLKRCRLNRRSTGSRPLRQDALAGRMYEDWTGGKTYDRWTTGLRV